MRKLVLIFALLFAVMGFQARAQAQLNPSGPVTVIQATGTNLHITCDSGCGGASAFTDNSAFTAGTTPVNITAAWYTTSPTNCSVGSACAPQLTLDRKLFVNAFQGTSPWLDNLTQWNSVALGSPSAYGTSPGAVNVPGVNAFITNTPAVTGSGNFTVVQPTGANLHIACDSGCGGAATFADNSAFTAGTTSINNIGAVFNDGLAAVTSSNAAALRITSDRMLFINLGKVGGSALALGQTTMASSLPVAFASNQSNLGVTQQTSPWVDNVTTWAGGTLGAMANYGTSPGAVLVPGVNAFITNTPTVTANAGTNLNTSLLQLDATGAKLNLGQGSTTSGQTGPLVQGAVTTSAPAYTTAQTSPLSLTTAGALRTDSSAVTQPVSGTVTSNIGTTNGLALDASVSGLSLSQGAATSGQKAVLVEGAVTTSAPTYTTANSNPLSLTTAGALRVDGSGVTQPVSGTVTANAGTGTFNIQANASVNNAQVAGATTATAASGVQKVGVVGNAGAAFDAATGAAPPANAVFAGGVVGGATGGFLGGIPVCDSYAVLNISTATTTLIVTGVSGRQVRICSANLVTAAADNVAVIEGTGATCGTGTAGMAGGTTAATGWNFAANGGLTLGGGIGTVMRTATAGDSVCIATSAATQLSGGLSYVIY